MPCTSSRARLRVATWQASAARGRVPAVPCHSPTASLLLLALFGRFALRRQTSWTCDRFKSLWRGSQMLTFLGKDMSFWRGIGRVVSVGRYLSSVAQSRVTRCISQCHPSRSLSSRRLSFLWNEAHRVGTDHARVRALSGGKDFPRDDAGGSARLGEPLDQLRSLLHKPTWSRGGENVPDKLVAKVCVQLLCEAGKSFRKAEAKSGKVSNLPVGFLRSVAGRIVEEHPDSVDKRAILKCAAEEIILHGNRLPVGHTAFVVGSVVGSGYRDLWFMTSVRCMTSNRLNDWMRNMKELAVVLRCLATDSKKDHLMLLMAVSKNFYLVLKAWNDSFPAGLGAILRDCHLHRIEVDHSISQRCLDVLNGHYTQLSCEDLMGMMSFLLQHKVPPSRSQCKAAHRKIMQVVDAVHWRLVKDVIAVTRSMCKTHPGLIWAFDKEGVFDTLHSVLERRVDEMSALGVGQCIADLHRLGRLSFPFLKAAPRVLIKQSHMFTHHYIAEMVCAAYGLSKVPQRSDVVSAIGGKMWSELETLTSQQVFSFLEAFWRVSRRPSFLDDYVSILLSSARGLSERNREYLIFFLMDLRMESKALAECLVADLVEKLDRSTEYVPASARLSVLRYATLCNVSLLSMAPYFTEDVLEGEES